MINFPLYSLKCKQESSIHAKNMQRAGIKKQ